jgi:outer membrane protein TolC
MTVAAVVSAVLVDNPDLRAARTQHRVAEAQRRQAGVMPDPTLSGALLPLLAGAGSSLAWNASLSADLRGIVSLRARRAGAKAAFEQVDAQLLWQEWQTASQAQLLAVQIIEGEQALAALRQTQALFAARSARLQRALAEGNVTLQTTAPDLAALQSARAQVDAAERTQLSRRHQLNALLGCEADAPLPLAARADLPPLDIDQIDRLAAEMARRRPDLIALRLGYQAQEAKTRVAVLMQFPLLNLGVAGGSDNSNVRNGGPQFTLAVPIFDGNRGDVAVQTATRAQLRAEYQARLLAAYGQIRAAVTELKAAEGQLAVLRTDLPAVERAAEQAQGAFNTGALDELAYVDLVGARAAKAGEIIALEQIVLEQRAALVAIVGVGLPSIDQLPDIAP